MVITIRALAVASLLSICQALPEDPVEYEAWKTGMLSAISEQTGSVSEDAIPKLGKWIRQLDNVSTSHRERDGRPVFFAAQKALLSIPGHADYYASRIKEAREKVEAAPRDEQGSLWAALQNEQMYGFQTLRQLPSPETIRVLGEFLTDERGRSRTKEELEIARGRGERSNAEWSLDTLAAMPLTYKPVQPRPLDATNFESDINAWRLWYEQIKAGNRTFRFEGGPQNYSLTGPVSEAREPNVAARSVGSKETPASAVETEEKAANLPIWPLALAGLLLAVSVWAATKRKPAAS